MKPLQNVNARMVGFWQSLGTRYMPFADAASPDLPLGRLLRLSLFQVSVGMAAVLLTGTLNRVMIIELGVAASLVAAMVAVPVLVAPMRVLIGHRSDNYRSFLGWRRVPFIWLGTLLQFGGLAIMPFALLLLQSQTTGPQWAGPVAAAFAFLLTGTGMHMAQTTGLALAGDLSPPEKRPRVVALLYFMLLVGMIGASLVFGWLLTDFSAVRMIQVIQGAALFTMIVNVIALWKQEPRNSLATAHERETPDFMMSLARYAGDKGTVRLLIAVALGSVAFSMQDVLLEPYGGEVLGMSVSQTTLLTAMWASGTMAGLALSARLLSSGHDMFRLAAIGALIGIAAFCAVIFSAPLGSVALFRTGTAFIGFGGGLFAVGTMLAAMDMAQSSDNGFAIGAWSATQATAIGVGLGVGGIAKDIFNDFAIAGSLGEALHGAASGYMFVYHFEIGLLFFCLAVMGPLVGRQKTTRKQSLGGFGLADMPG